MKQCRKCNERKGLDQFQKNASKVDGLQSYCRDCMNQANRESAARHVEAHRARNAKYDAEHAEERKAYRAAWREANVERIKARNAAYRETHREELREASRVYTAANSERLKAKYAADPEPAKARAKKYAAKNPERVLAQNQKWRAEHPERHREYMRRGAARRRARVAELPMFHVTAKDTRRLLSSPCAVTGCEGTDIQIDHVVPVVLGGTHGIGNFQPLCKSHNSAKSDRLWIEFRVYLATKAALAA